MADLTVQLADGRMAEIRVEDGHSGPELNAYLVGARTFVAPNPCIHTPSRCNGGGYDGCACGPYPKEGA